MPALDLEFHQGAVFLPGLGLWLDAHHPVTGPERVFVSHAHSDHTAPHREVILSVPTSRLMQARLGGERLEHPLAFHESREFQGTGVPYRITLLPAGHIFGSAMAWIEAGGETLLYTGDFKLRPGLSAERCEPRRADLLVMETTFGRPEYRFPPTEAVIAGVVRFCRETLAEGETAVLLGYSLGKSQEILRSLADAGLPLVLHEQVLKLTRIYEQLGQTFPPYEPFEASAARGKVVLCPPNVSRDGLLKTLGATRFAVLTGWAMNPNCRFQYGVQAAFPLSDHADYPDLLKLVEQVAPRRVLTLHGFAADFAAALRERGLDARALGETEQLALPLLVPSRAGSRMPDAGCQMPDTGYQISDTGCRMPDGPCPMPEAGYPDAEAGGEDLAPSGDPEAFSGFARTCAAIARTGSKLDKIARLADYLRTVPPAWLPRVVVWFTGQPFAPVENRTLKVGWAALRQALRALAAVDEDDFRQVYLRHGDAGEAAAELWRRRPVPRATVTLGEVSGFFEAALVARGPTAKVPLLMRALGRCTAGEVKYLVKIITGDLRIGLKEGLVEEAIALAFGAGADQVRRAHLLLGHPGETADLARQGRLAAASLVPFRPVKLMLASPEPTAAAVWQRMAASQQSHEPVMWLEDKYDGIRCQLHKAGPRVTLFSRDSRDITATFPELADAARRCGSDVILDGEILAMRGDDVLPFAELQKRLGRREGDLFLGEDIPVRFVAFDLLWCDGESLLDQPLGARRARLEGLAPWASSLALARRTSARSPEAIEAAFLAARARKNEGLMIKDPTSPYTPGRRGLAWIKLKKAFATLDCVVVGAEYGHGKRKGVLSDYTFAVRDEADGALRTLGKAYTGLTDPEIADLTRHFLGRVIRQRGGYLDVEPDIVLEIAFDRIQPSKRHNSGLALRFPRIARIRRDKSVPDIDTLGTARKLAGIES